MTPQERHRRVSELFLEACECAADMRGAFLDRQCADDPNIAADVKLLLARESKSKGLIDQPVLGKGFVLQTPAAFTEPVEGIEPWDQEGEEDPRGQPIPERIGKYRILDVLGEGGMGIVYLAEQERPRRKVALKVLKPGAATKATMRRFEHETQLLGRLQHPGIAQIFEAGIETTEHGRRQFFAMEYVDGHPLTDYATAEGLDSEQRLALLARVCRAVQYAHQKGIIHRDLKPGNILIDGQGAPKILDFGVARMADSDLRSTTLRTSFGQLIGTLPYMSPEQVAGDPDELDTRSDIYALGVIGYELLAQCLPHDFGTCTIIEAARIIKEEKPPSLKSVNRSLRGDVETIISKALEKDASRRYQSANDLGTDIERFLKNQPILAQRAGVGYRVGRFAQRYKGLLIAASLAVSAWGVGSFYLAVLEQERLEEKAILEEKRIREQAILADKRFEEAKKLTTQGVEYTTDRERRAAEAKFAEALQIDPDNFLALANWAILLKDEYNDLTEPNPKLLQRANDLIDRALRIRPDNAEAWNVNGILLKKSGHLEAAIRAYKRSTTLDPDNALAWDNLAALHAMMGNHETALEHMQRAADVASSLVPPFCEAWRDLASIQLFLGDWSSANQNIGEALECNRGEPGVVLIAARIHTERQNNTDWREALAELTKADVVARGRNPKIKRLRALCELRLDRFDEAVYSATRAIDEGGTSTFNYLIISMAESRRGRPQAAQGALDDANREWPVELANPGEFVATSDKGLLWFDRADQLFDLQQEAESAIIVARQE